MHLFNNHERPLFYRVTDKQERETNVQSRKLHVNTKILITYSFLGVCVCGVVATLQGEKKKEKKNDEMPFFVCSSKSNVLTSFKKTPRLDSILLL